MSAKQTAVILYDNSRPEWQDLSSRMMDFTRFRLSDAVHSPLIHWVETTDLDSTLRGLPDSIQWAVIVTSGNFVSHSLVVDKIIDHCIKEQAVMSGHIIERHGYYHLHPQFLCLHVPTFLKYPGVLDPKDQGLESITTPSINRSPDNVHDDYTPWWIKPADQKFLPKIIECHNFAQSYIAWLMCNGHQVVNVPQDIRGDKKYSYVDYCHEDIRKFISDSSYSVGQEGGISEFFNYMRWTQKSLEKGFYVLNTEHFLPINENENSIKSFAGVCGGIKPAMIVSQPSFDINCRIILFDISQAAIDWQKHLRNQWDGKFENLKSVLDNFISLYPDSQPSYFTHLGMEGNIEWFIQNRFTREQVYEAWQRWLDRPVEYKRLNMLEESSQNEIIQSVKINDGKSYIWTSNLFYMDWMMFYYGNQWASDNLNRFESKLNGAGFPIILENAGSTCVYDNKILMDKFTTA